MEGLAKGGEQPPFNLLSAKDMNRRLHPADPVQTAVELLAEIEQTLALLPCESLPELLGRLEAVKVTTLIRLTARQAVSPDRDELLGVEQAAARLGVSTDYLYRHRFPFSVRVGRSLRFSSRGIDEYIRKRSGRNY